MHARICGMAFVFLACAALGAGGAPARRQSAPTQTGGSRHVIEREPLPDEVFERMRGGEKPRVCAPGELWKVRSSLDGKVQPVIVFTPPDFKKDRPTPLFVLLHTWGGNYRQQVGAESVARTRGWLVALPHFRGPNRSNVEACGSIAAQHDIIDAVNAVKQIYRVDEAHVYLAGASGGGMMTMLMAGKYPDLWTAANPWCGISDLARWHQEHKGVGYGAQIVSCIRGSPGDSEQVDWEYLRRSPITFAANAAALPLWIVHGKEDTAVLPNHSVRYFERIKDAGGEMATLTLGDFGHRGGVGEGVKWLAAQQRPADPPKRLTLVTDESKAYYYVTLTPANPTKLGRCRVEVTADDVNVQSEGLSVIEFDISRMGLAQARDVTFQARNSGPACMLVFSRPEGRRIFVKTDPGATPQEMKPARDGQTMSTVIPQGKEQGE